MKKAILALLALGFVLTSSSFAEETKKKDSKATWKALPKEMKDKLMAINKKQKDGELTEEAAKEQKKAIWKTYNQSKKK